ncbi:uncharacterized protein EV422DRAFT_487756, partial [Fimicolochytrium jonesii]|uniref:uncharacterized protein n=1 Tax=Fimicolochytrium jonesii TaxID=1396493 RepID=UPI0022FEF60B
HDVVCSHLYHTGYMQALYADLIVRLQLGGSTGTVPNGDGASPTDAVHFKLHRIIAIRSPYFASALAEMEANGEYAPVATLTIHQHDPNLTPEGLSIAFGHLYGLFSQSHLTDGSDHDLPPQQRSARLRSVLSAATLLQLDDLASLAGELIKSDISRTTVLDYCHFASHPDFGASYGKHSQDIREAVLVYLTRGVVRDVADQFGIVWGNRDGEGYKELVATFAELPFEWLKKVVESKGFEVPGDMERFNFAKEIVALRQRRRQAGGGGNPRAGGPPAGATVPNRLLAGEENVLLAFGSKDRSGVTIVRKAVR